MYRRTPCLGAYIGALTTAGHRHPPQRVVIATSYGECTPTAAMRQGYLSVFCRCCCGSQANLHKLATLAYTLLAAFGGRTHISHHQPCGFQCPICGVFTCRLLSYCSVTPVAANAHTTNVSLYHGTDKSTRYHQQTQLVFYRCVSRGLVRHRPTNLRL